jgi:signal transduction histidine kinase
VYQTFLKFSKRLLFIGVSLFVMTDLMAQQTKAIDSLKSLLKESEGTARFDVLYDITFEYIVENEFDQALQYVEEAQTISAERGDSLRIVKAGRVRSQILRRLERTSDAIAQFKKVLPIARRNGYASEYKYILNGLGLAYTLQSDYDKALDYHFQGLMILEKDGDTRQIYETLNNIGLVYYKLRDYDRALDFYFRSLEYERRIENSGFRSSLLINIGNCYNQLGKFLEARKYINEALQTCDDDCSDAIRIEGQFGIGVSYYIESNSETDTVQLSGIYHRSRDSFLRSYEVAQGSDNKRWQVENLVYLARIYVRLKSTDLAEEALKKAEAVVAHTEYKLLLIETYRGFSTLYVQTKKFEQAALYQEKYIHLRDSTYSEALIKNISKVQTDFEERQNRATIASNKLALKRQRDLNISVAIIAILAGLLILVLQRSNRTIKRVNVALSDAKEIIEDQNAKLQLLNTDLDNEVKIKTADLEKANHSLHRVVDELDNFIYKTSHDIRGPLASLKGICNIALLDVKDEVALKYLSKLDVTAEKLNTILTRLLIVNQINNSSIKLDELVNFEQVVNDVLLLERKKGLPPRLLIRKSIEPDIVFYSDKEFIRIILENLIDNAIKFFNDSDRIEPFVDIRISKEGRNLVIRVIDNGIGISEIHPDKIFQMFSRASERSETGGIGLFITKTATEKLGGTVGLKTTPEGYTEFFVKFQRDQAAWKHQSIA